MFVGIIGTLKIATTEEIDTYRAKECLKDKVQFLRCVFMYQVALKERFEDEINILGIIILEILITINTWAFNVLIFVTLISCICAKGIWNGFCFIFKKKGAFEYMHQALEDWNRRDE